MKLTLSRAALGKALDFVSRVAQKRTTIPILANLRLTASGEKLTLAATDLDLEAHTALEADITAPGDLTVPAATFAEIVRKLAADAVTLEFDAVTSRLVIRAGRAKFHLATLPSSDFPTLEKGEITHRFTLPAEGLARAIKKTSFAISTEKTRYYLNGIYFHADETELRLVATDGHRLARIAAPLPDGIESSFGVIVPRLACVEIQRLAEAAAKDDKAGAPHVDIELSNTKIMVRSGETTILSKLIDGSFPDYTRVIPTQNVNIALVSCGETASAAERVSTVSSERGKAVKLVFEGPTLALSVANPDVGSAAEEVESDYSGAHIEIGFNSRYLADALSALDGDNARIELNDSQSPTILRTATDADLLIVLMPMRV
jgi:DNA polymerase-3 subunit beta